MTDTPDQARSTGATDHEIARALAVDAGRLLVDLRTAMAKEGATEREIKDAGDRRSHLFLMPVNLLLLPSHCNRLRYCYRLLLLNLYLLL